MKRGISLPLAPVTMNSTTLWAHITNWHDVSELTQVVINKHKSLNSFARTYQKCAMLPSPLFTPTGWSLICYALRPERLNLKVRPNDNVLENFKNVWKSPKSRILLYKCYKRARNFPSLPTKHPTSCNCLRSMLTQANAMRNRCIDWATFKEYNKSNGD